MARQSARQSESTERSGQPAGASEGDVLLSELVRLADDQGLEVGITVYIGGTVISGMLVSGQEFLEASALRLQSVEGPPETKATLEHFFRSQRDQQYASSGAASTEGEDVPSVGYLHLRGARPFDAKGPYLEEGVWWRGRIDQIDGFNFGVIRPQ